MTDKKQSRSKYILMSTLIIPGLGQCVMKRWAIGIFYALGFLLSALIFLLTLLNPLVKNFMMLTDMSNGDEVTKVAWPWAIFWLVATVFIYCVNFIDIVVSTRTSKE